MPNKDLTPLIQAWKEYKEIRRKEDLNYYTLVAVLVICVILLLTL